MTEALRPYLEKRDFTVTREPKGGAGATAGSLAFVVQKHAASHLHYDFRLELDGTLKSWAVPKGPSLDPADKRMAVQVEDHPLDYASFEGEIPKGQYGGGSVIVWDNGTWRPVGDAHAGYRAGKLKFRLHGQKLHGGWTLVRMRGRGNERQEPWLLIKERDDAARPASEYSVVEAEPRSVLSQRTIDGVASAAAKKTPAKSAGARAKKTAATAVAAKAAGTKAALPEGAEPAPLPQTLAPELATLVAQAPGGPGWIYEIKFDGYRLLARVDGDDVRLCTRNGNDWTARLPGLAQEVRKLGIGSGWLDGEIVVAGANGASDFNLLQKAFDAPRSGAIEYYVFDLPYHGGRDLRVVPLTERRALLRKLLDAAPGEGRVRFSEDFNNADAAELLHNACRMHLEGVIGKRADSPYVSRRSPAWIKLKCTQRQEFVIGGYTDPKGARIGIGSLLLGIHDEAGALQFAGGVGSGFDEGTLRAVKKALTAVESKQQPFTRKPPGANAHWVAPTLVAEVSFGEWTPDGRIRHAVFHGLRSDKPAEAIVRERPVAAKVVERATVAEAKSAHDATVEGIRISHADRVIDPSSGLTKLDLANYYLAVARLILPHLARRPVSLVRAPAGIDGHLFFQKHAGALKIRDLKILDRAIAPDLEPMVEVDSFTALISAAQANVIEFHTWNATTKDTTLPDRMIFDLDPGERVAWPTMREGAELVRALLLELGLASFVKTSGGKGLHVVVPITPKEDWDTVKALSKKIVEHLAQTLPDRFVAKSGAKNRVGKIFADYLRNGFGSTTACAWSARARPGLGISVPCTWEELATIDSGAHWTIANVHDRLEEHSDPWAMYAKTRQTLSRATRALA